MLGKMENKARLLKNINPLLLWLGYMVKNRWFSHEWGSCYDRARSQTQDQGIFQKRSVLFKRRVESQRINLIQSRTHGTRIVGQKRVR